MVQLRFFAAGGPKDCWIEEKEGSVIESVGNVPAPGSKAKPKLKRKAHPPTVVNGQPADYIQRLVETKVREGWKVVNSEEDASERMYFSLRVPMAVFGVPELRKVLTAFGIESPLDEDQKTVESTRFMFENVEVATEPNGANTMITAISGKQSAPALATLFLVLSPKLSQATYGDGKEVKLLEYVLKARDIGLIRSEHLESAYDFNVLGRPFNVSALTRNCDRRSRFSVSI